MNALNNMETKKEYRFSLERGSTKFECPHCKHWSFVKYRDNDTEKYISDDCGRCDRENHCGHHYTPAQYFKEHGIEISPVEKKEEHPAEVKPISYMPVDLVRKSMNGYDRSNFGEYIIKLFGEAAGKALLRKYLVGRSKADNGKGNIFWRIDASGNVRTGKIMVYHTGTGKRNKDIHPVWAHNSMNDFNYELCFFGEHLITEYPEKTIAVCESEKTAIIASFFFPQFVWLGTGGASGCKWREFNVFKVFKNRNVILFPDFGWYNRKKEITCYQEWKNRATAIMDRMTCSIQVSTVLEKNIPQEERLNDYDLVDMLVKSDEKTGVALTDDGYPVLWDHATEFATEFQEC